LNCLMMAIFEKSKRESSSERYFFSNGLIHTLKQKKKNGEVQLNILFEFKCFGNLWSVSVGCILQKDVEDLQRNFVLKTQFL
jgi:hypothetical protein